MHLYSSAGGTCIWDLKVLISYVVLCKPKPHEEVVPVLFSTHISAYGHGVLQVRK
jgi:hypothetical protein